VVGRSSEAEHSTRYIIGADAVHHLYLGEYLSLRVNAVTANTPNHAGEFKKAYPEAKLVAVEAAIEKKKNEGLSWAGCMLDSLLFSIPLTHITSLG
jgi:hypothetical protein